MLNETPETILEVAREIVNEGHPPETRIARLAVYVKETLEGMNIGKECPHRNTCHHGK